MRSSAAVSSWTSSANCTGVEPTRLEPRIAELLEQLELTPWKDELVESYSHGMKQRLVVCARADSRTAHPDRRRAHGRHGSQRRAHAQRSFLRSGQKRHHGFSLDPQHRRRRGDLPPHRHHPKRPPDRLRLDGRDPPPMPPATSQSRKRLSRTHPRAGIGQSMAARQRL